MLIRDNHNLADAGAALTTENHGRHLDTQLILAIILASVAFAAIILGLFGMWFYRRNNHSRPDSNGAQNRGTSLLIFVLPVGIFLKDDNEAKVSYFFFNSSS